MAQDSRRGGYPFDGVRPSEHLIEHKPHLLTAALDVVEHASQLTGLKEEVALAGQNGVLPVDQRPEASRRQNGLSCQADPKGLGEEQIDGESLNEGGLPCHI